MPRTGPRRCRVISAMDGLLVCSALQFWPLGRSTPVNCCAVRADLAGRTEPSGRQKPSTSSWHAPRAGRPARSAIAVSRSTVWGRLVVEDVLAIGARTRSVGPVTSTRKVTWRRLSPNVIDPAAPTVLIGRTSATQATSSLTATPKSPVAVQPSPGRTGSQVATQARVTVVRPDQRPKLVGLGHDRSFHVGSPQISRGLRCRRPGGRADYTRSPSLRRRPLRGTLPAGHAERRRRVCGAGCTHGVDLEAQAPGQRGRHAHLGLAVPVPAALIPGCRSRRPGGPGGQPGWAYPWQVVPAPRWRR